MTGERPTLAESPTTTGDPAVDAVLDRLDAAGEATFTAGYDVLTKFGNVSTPATVVAGGPDAEVGDDRVGALPHRRRDERDVRPRQWRRAPTRSTRHGSATPS